MKKKQTHKQTNKQTNSNNKRDKITSTYHSLCFTGGDAIRQ